MREWESERVRECESERVRECERARVRDGEGGSEQGAQSRERLAHVSPGVRGRDAPTWDATHADRVRHSSTKVVSTPAQTTHTSPLSSLHDRNPRPEPRECLFLVPPGVLSNSFPPHLISSCEGRGQKCAIEEEQVLLWKNKYCRSVLEEEHVLLLKKNKYWY